MLAPFDLAACTCSQKNILMKRAGLQLDLNLETPTRQPKWTDFSAGINELAC